MTKAFTFPIGVWATATNLLASSIDSAPLRVIGTIISLSEVSLWLVVGCGTVWTAWDGSMYVPNHIPLSICVLFSGKTNTGSYTDSLWRLSVMVHLRKIYRCLNYVLIQFDHYENLLSKALNGGWRLRDPRGRAGPQISAIH